MPKAELPRKEETRLSDRREHLMKLALALAAVTAVYLGWRGTRAAIRRIREARFTYHWLTAAEATNEHAHLIEPPKLDLITDGWTCLRCRKNPALTTSVWCRPCGRIVEATAAEPIEKQGGAA
jgi:hypothetical protein